MRIYLANVGANSSHGQLVSPLFENGTFELLPIPEIIRTREARERTVRYRDLRSHYNPEQDLLQYIPQKMWDNACHNDPEFKTLTYGDNGTNGRSSALTQLGEGDALLFIARLEQRTAISRTRHSGFYLIGGLLVLQRRQCEICNPGPPGMEEVLQQRTRHQGRHGVPGSGRLGAVPKVPTRRPSH